MIKKSLKKGPELRPPEKFYVPAKDRYMFGDLFLHYESSRHEEERRKSNPFIKIGRNVKIKSGTIIGGDGFSYKRDDKGILKHGNHSYGVRIDDNVDVGSCVCIDRGSWRDTVIGEGTKVDNLCHISHNVTIGRHCLIGPHVTILGSCDIEDYSTIWSGAIIQQHTRVAHHSVIGANSYLRHSTEPHQTWYGNPAVLKESD